MLTAGFGTSVRFFHGGELLDDVAALCIVCRFISLALRRMRRD